jgi:hypothetical protein
MQSVSALELSVTPDSVTSLTRSAWFAERLIELNCDHALDLYTEYSLHDPCIFSAFQEASLCKM